MTIPEQFPDPRVLQLRLLKIVKGALSSIEAMSAGQQLKHSSHIERLSRVLINLEKRNIGFEDYEKLSKADYQEKLKEAQKMLKLIPDNWNAGPAVPEGSEDE